MSSTTQSMSNSSYNPSDSQTYSTNEECNTLNNTDARDRNLVTGYLREQQQKFFNGKYSNNKNIYIVILMYWAGMEVIDRYGFLIKHMLPEQQHRKQIQKENQRLLKWQVMIFPKRKGGASAEADNQLEAQIRHWQSVKDHKKLKSRIRKGIPNQLRGTIWQNLCGSRERAKIELVRYGAKTLYNDLKRRRKSPQKDQIWKDINRTYRENIAFGGVTTKPKNNANKHAAAKFFKYTIHTESTNNKNIQQKATPTQTAVYNVLKSFSLYRKDVGYCQGMQSVVALLIMYMTEEEAFWVLASLADDIKYQMEHLWRDGMPAIPLRFYQIERLVSDLLPKLASHFEKNGIVSASMYQAPQWFVTIFLATHMRFDIITRIWDIYLNEGFKTVFRMGIAYLKYHEKTLLQSNFEQMYETFSNGAATMELEKFLKTCFEIRITHAQLAGYEIDFNKKQKR